MTKVFTIASLLLTAACTVSTAPSPEPTPMTPDPTAAASSFCVLDQSGVRVSCGTSDAESWVWMHTTASDGEQPQRCDYVACPTGATCVVQTSVTSDGAGELLMGKCQ